MPPGSLQGGQLISCVVPAFNSARYLEEALDSILAQTYRPIEVIVADDGSVDRTVDIARMYGDPVSVVSQPTTGPAATRNLGVRSAQGAFVAFLDADDRWHPDKLTCQMARFEVLPDLQLCLSAAQLFWTPGLEAEAERYKDHPRAQPLPGYATTTLLARKTVFDTVGLFDTDLWFADATEWFIRAADHGAVLEMVEEVLTFHRMHVSNLTRRRSEASRSEFAHVVGASLRRRRRSSGSQPYTYSFPGLSQTIRD